MSYADLLRLGVTLRPFEDPPKSGGVPSPFDARLTQTIEVLARELQMLDARHVVLQLGYRDRDLRVDGLPRANARMTHDAVALSFESKWGPLRYETNEFTGRYYRGQEGWSFRRVIAARELLRG